MAFSITIASADFAASSLPLMVTPPTRPTSFDPFGITTLLPTRRAFIVVNETSSPRAAVLVSIEVNRTAKTLLTWFAFVGCAREVAGDSAQSTRNKQQLRMRDMESKSGETCRSRQGYRKLRLI